MSRKTSQSLLNAAKDDPGSEAWLRLHSIYDPLIAGWIARLGIRDTDVSDITQEVLLAIASNLSTFEHNGRTGAFRSWLKQITIFRCRRYWDQKKKHESAGATADGSEVSALDQLEDPNSELSRLWQTEHDSFVFNKLIEYVRAEYKPEEFEVFVQNAIEGQSPKEISEKHGITVGKVYKIKFKIFQRLREVAEGILEGDWMAN